MESPGEPKTAQLASSSQARQAEGQLPGQAPASWLTERFLWSISFTVRQSALWGFLRALWVFLRALWVFLKALWVILQALSCS